MLLISATFRQGQPIHWMDGFLGGFLLAVFSMSFLVEKRMACPKAKESKT